MDSRIIIGIMCTLLLFYTWMQREKINRLELELSYSQESQTNLLSAIEMQNDEIEKLRIVDREPIKADLSYVTVKDSSCSSELAAYKQLFRELAR